MRDYLLDLVEHTYDLGCIDLVKIVGDTSKSEIVGLAEDLSVVIRGNFHNPVADFVGTFGMPNLGKLKTLLNLQEYKENAKLTITKRADGEPDGITFENKIGDFKNNYRFMASGIVNEKLKTAKIRPVTWHIEFEPTNAAIQRLKWQMSANANVFE
jgi:hypothetical protein